MSPALSKSTIKKKSEGKRLYMTAIPRIYGEIAKKKEMEGVVALASMDNENMFGETLVNRSFGWAVENNLLADYKVVVLVMDERVVSDLTSFARLFPIGAVMLLKAGYNKRFQARPVENLPFSKKIPGPGQISVRLVLGMSW